MKFNRDVDIAELDNESPHMPTVAKWLNETWGKTQGYDLSDTLAWCRQLANATNETIMVAKLNGQPVGTVSVVACDLKGREDLTPWLSSLFVTLDEREKMIGKALIGAACDWARLRRCSNLYLYAQQGRLTSYYGRLGWSHMDAFNLDGVKFELMRMVLPKTADKG
jgi:predicted N-acetyltransferase YhbS